jgi:hypothetical protein
MASLEPSYQQWRAEPFPASNGSDEFGEVHANLVLIDSWVAEYVIPFVERGVTPMPRVDVAGALTDLRQQLADLDLGAAPAKEALALDYSRYVMLLDEVWQAFLRAREG